MLFDPTPVLSTKHRWSLYRSGNLNQQPEPEFRDENGSRKPDRSINRLALKPALLDLASDGPVFFTTGG